MSGPLGSQQWMYSTGFYPYEIGQSLRFNDDDTAYLSRAYSSSQTGTKATLSFWCKRSNLINEMFWQARDVNNSNSLRTYGYFESDRIRFYCYDSGGSLVLALITSQVFRDVSAWYHILVKLDTTQATASDRASIYVNGSKVTSFSTETYPSQNFAFRTVSSVYTDIGRNGGVSNELFDGYMADYYFIDGQALDPTSFGEFKSGVWIPKSYSGSYGTNGFYLDFGNSGSLGADSSGNGNNWTPNNLAATDQVPDSPTNNFATLNPLKNYANTLSNGNLDFVASNSTASIIFTTIGITSGKYYWECTQTAFSTNSGLMIGVAKDNVLMTTYPGGDANGWSYWGYDGSKYNNASGSAYGDTFGNNDVIGIAFDADAGTLTFYKNNVSQGTAFTGLTSGPYFPAFGDGFSTGGITASINFGQDSSFAGTKTAQGNTDARGIGDFYYAPPAGYLALCTANLPDPAIDPAQDDVPADYFNTVLYTGTGANLDVNTVGFQSDFVWLKSRSNASTWHILADGVRGANKHLSSNNGEAEKTDAEGVEFIANGFSLGADSVDAYYGWNLSGNTYVAWNWLAGNGTSSNTDGTITSTVSANQKAGFSIVSYTGTGTNGATIGHGLSSAPDLLMVKDRSQAVDWHVYHSANTSAPETEYLILNQTLATIDAIAPWNDTAPTSSVFTVGTGVAVNTNGNNYIAYCFHSVEGFSKFGSYTGNGSTDGPFVYTGFRPAFVMVKWADSTGEWGMHDSARDVDNVVGGVLFAHASDAEYTGYEFYDFTSNGFKIRSSNANRNASGGTYIFMAFSEMPFKYSNAR